MEEQIKEEIMSLNSELDMFLMEIETQDIDEDFDLEHQTGELVLELVMTARRLWLLLDKPEWIRYPVHIKRGRTAYNDTIMPSRKTTVAPISNLFGLILGDT